MRLAWITDTITADLDRALHYTLLWGLEAVVLRTVGRVGDRVPHVNEAKLRRRLVEHDVEAAAVDPGVLEASASDRALWLNDLAVLEETARFCRRIGCARILTGALPPESGDGAPSPTGTASRWPCGTRRARGRRRPNSPRCSTQPRTRPSAHAGARRTRSEWGRTPRPGWRP